MFIIEPVSQIIDHRFRNIAQNRKPAVHIAVKCTISDGDFRFVAGTEKQPAELVGNGHEHHAPEARLEIFFGEVMRKIVKNGLQRQQRLRKKFAYGNNLKADSKPGCEFTRVAQAFGSVKRPRHSYPENVLSAQRKRGQAGSKRGIHPAA